YPPGRDREATVWKGALNQENARLLMDSPARRAIARHLLRSVPLVWVLLESGDPSRDEAAVRLLPSGFPLVRVARTDSAEMMFVALFRNCHTELTNGGPAV